MKNIEWDKVLTYSFYSFIAAYIIFGILYTLPKDIHYEYNGIKYEAGNPKITEQIRIEIYGSFKRKLWGFNDIEQFEGNILIDGNDQFKNLFIFNEDRMCGIVTKSFKGDLYMKNMLTEITILIYDSEGRFYFNSGWIISGPSENREQAVEITNRLIKKRHPRMIE